MTGRNLKAVLAASAAFSFLAPAVLAQGAYERAMQQVTDKTGLKTVVVPDTEGAYMGKTHRGYEVLFTAKMGNVWGRYAARLTMAEIGREAGGLRGFATGQRKSGEVVGGPLDRMLSEQIGQPVSITMILRHGKANAPRLDVISGYAKVLPPERMQEREKIGHNAGSIYSDDAAFAARLAQNAALMKRMKNLRSEYIRVDADAVTLFWSGSERDYGGMINDHGDYYRMINDMMDDLADIADAIS